MAKTVLIANSVGIDSNGYAIIHSPSRWTNSCKDKNVFTYYPWELAYTSSLLKRESDENVVLIDGCLEKLDRKSFFSRIEPYAPDFIVMDVSTRTFAEDAALAQMCRDTYGTKIIFCGQHPTAFPEDVSRFADFACIGEYEYTVLDIILGKSKDKIPGLYGNPRRPLLDVNTLPWPEDTDIARIEYGIPGEPSCQYLEIQAYATRGCPMNCSFCVCRHLYYAQRNWRPREIDNIIKELCYLRSKYPQMEGIFFDEEVHNANKSFIMHLTKAICDNHLNDLHYNVMCGYWTIDKEMLSSMKDAGYYMVRVGIETASDKVAEGIGLGKKFNLPRLFEVLNEAKQIDMKMYGTFTFGAPGSSDKEDKKTIELLDRLVNDGLLWRFQLSICTPQPGTPYHAWAQKHGYLKNTVDWSQFDGGNFSVVDYPHYKAEQIVANYEYATRYYDLAAKNRSSAELRNSIREMGISSAKNILFFRTSRQWHIQEILPALKKKYRAAQITMLTQPSFMENTLQMNDVDRAISLPRDEFIVASDFPEKLLAELKSKKFDLVVIPYNNPGGRGYCEVETVAQKITSNHIIGIDTESSIFRINTEDKMRLT